MKTKITIAIAATVMLLAACGGATSPTAKEVAAELATMQAPKVSRQDYSTLAKTPPVIPPTSVDNGSDQSLACIMDAKATALIGTSVQGVGTEPGCAWTFRSYPDSRQVVCPQGWLCTLHLSGDQITVVEAGSYSAKAGTFRAVASYPAGDDIHLGICKLLEKERAWSATRNPPFPVYGPAKCPAAAVAPAAPAPAQVAPTAAPAASGKLCPTSTASVAALLGGPSASWKLEPDTNGQGWVYRGSNTTITHPGFGRVDRDGPSLAQKGQQATGSAFTFWCLGK